MTTARNIKHTLIKAVLALDEVDGQLINTPENRRLYNEIDWLMAFVQLKIDRGTKYLSNFEDREDQDFIHDSIHDISNNFRLPSHLYSIFVELEDLKNELRKENE